ncbi:MAG: DUF1028 domain-containing protein [Acidimicrobiia bacterium]
MTYTVVARAPGVVGAATCSHSMFLGAKTVHLAPEIPAIAVSQAFSSPAVGQAALADLRSGVPVTDAGRAAMEADDAGDLRQLLVVTPDGVAAATGAACVAAAGDGIAADGSLAVAGNMLADDTVAPAMLAAADTQLEADLIDRLLGVLSAGEAAGGDFRGSRSAALVVLGGAAPVRLTIDDHDDPVGELIRLAEAARADAVLRRCMAWLQSGQPADADLRAAVDALAGRVRTAEAWAVLLAGGTADDAHDPFTRRMVAAFAPIRDRFTTEDDR